MIITTIDAPDAQGDAYFPEFNESDWEASRYETDPSLKITHYRRKPTR